MTFLNSAQVDTCALEISFAVFQTVFLESVWIYIWKIFAANTLKVD